MSRVKIRSALLGVANHWRSLAIVFVLSALLPAAVYAIVEPYTFIESLEWSTYMLTSTGLGSHNATTLVGQIMGIVLMFWGPVLLLALFTGAVVNALRVDPNVFTDDEQKELLEGNRRMVAYIDRMENQKKAGPPPNWFEPVEGLNSNAWK